MTNALGHSPKLRFTSRELLVATALLAVGFTWPLLLVFIIPLLAVIGLSRARFGIIAPFVVVAALSLVLGSIFSQLYWRYLFVPPPPLEEFGNIAVLEQLSLVSNFNPEGVTAEAETNLPQVQFSWLETTERIFQQFRTRNLRIRSTERLSSELLNSIWNAANQSGLLVSGEQGYKDTRTLAGYVGVGVLNDGTQISFAALMGGEHSNDHYPYYEIVLRPDEDGWTIVNSQCFFVDIAGIEGMNWLSFAVMSFVVMAPIVAGLEIAWAMGKAYYRHRAARVSDTENRRLLNAPAGGPSRTPPSDLPC